MAWGWNSDEEPEQGNISRKARVGRQEGEQESFGEMGVWGCGATIGGALPLKPIVSWPAEKGIPVQCL